MKDILKQTISTAISQLQAQFTLPDSLSLDIQIERSKDDSKGDFACNIALMLAKQAGMKPRELAEKIVAQVDVTENIKKIEIAGPGFINFFLSEHAFLSVIHTVLAERTAYGTCQQFKNTPIHLEYVSSNPTGPLHVGHGRSAAYGASLANLLEAVGYKVHREYYVNDAGRQMHILATSVWLRYLALSGVNITFPVNGYQGEYVKVIAEQLMQEHQQAFVVSKEVVLADVPADLNDDGEGDKEKHIDGLINNAKTLLGVENYSIIFQLALKTILTDIREDLAGFRVTFDEWFSEQQLIDNGMIEHTFDVLREKGYLYEKEGALWFKASEFGDEKDRVLQKSNGDRTYFANDIAYHLNKLERGNAHIIDVLGADHHGYIARMRAAIEAFTGKKDVLTVPLIQFVSLYRGKEKVAMSTRGGEFVTLRELRNEVGNDAARFFYVMRKADQAMDFDLELAKSRSNENPVYYIQYAHARICSVFRQLKEKKLTWIVGEGVEHLEQLTESPERALLKFLGRYPEVVFSAATQYEPHQLVHYLRELAADFHSYYNTSLFIVEDEPRRCARLHLITVIKQVLANGLALLGVSAPESM